MKWFIILAALLILAMALEEDDEDRRAKGSRGSKGSGVARKGRKRVKRPRNFTSFAQRHRKRYRSAEEAARRHKIWSDRIQRIEKHNDEAENGTHTYTMDENHFTDYTDEELKSLTAAIPPEFFNREFIGPFEEPTIRQDLPGFVDLRFDSCMPPMKHQRTCGSCWAFAAVTPLEYQNCVKYGKNETLSEQQLVSCSTQGCSGGFYRAAWQYIRNVGGLQTAADYPYVNARETCTFNASKVAVQVDSFGVTLPFRTEDGIKAAIADKGPIPVAVFANRNFFYYKDGIYFDPTCPRNAVNHAVVLVGYGTDEEGTDYWVLRNSWGTTWGLDGYMLIRRNVNQCGVGLYGFYVNIV